MEIGAREILGLLCALVAGNVALTATILFRVGGLVEWRKTVEKRLLGLEAVRGVIKL